MLSGLDRHRTGFVCAVLGAAAAACALSLASQARADDERLTKAGQAGQPIVLREHAGWDADCAAVPYPALHLDAPPRHGAVCARIEDIKVRYMVAGTESQCVGRIVRGLRLFYYPQAGFVGSDSLQYSVQYPSARRTVAVSVSVGAEGAGGRGALPANVVAAPGEPRQAPGLVPACLDRV